MVNDGEEWNRIAGAKKMGKNMNSNNYTTFLRMVTSDNR